MSVSFKGRAAVVAGGLLMQSVALGSMGNIGTTYGVLPFDLATAQALSLFRPRSLRCRWHHVHSFKFPLHFKHWLRLKVVRATD